MRVRTAAGVTSWPDRARSRNNPEQAARGDRTAAPRPRAARPAPSPCLTRIVRGLFQAFHPNHHESTAVERELSSWATRPNLLALTDGEVA